MILIAVSLTDEWITHVTTISYSTPFSYSGSLQARGRVCKHTRLSKIFENDIRPQLSDRHVIVTTVNTYCLTAFCKLWLALGTAAGICKIIEIKQRRGSKHAKLIYLPHSPLNFAVTLVLEAHACRFSSQGEP